MVRSYNDGVSLLEQHFEIEGSALMEADHHGLAGEDEQRAAELNAAFRSAKSRALIAGRGGYGCLRLLKHIDFEAAKTRPKALIGFSDLTILQLALYRKIGLVSFSGPMVGTVDSRELRRMLPLLTGVITGIDLIEKEDRKSIEVLSPGIAEGVLLGGNLYSIVQLIGTGFLPRFENSILFFEDVNETVDHIDSFLQHLKLAGQLYGIAGVVIGNIDWRKDGKTSSRRQNEVRFRERLRGLFRRDIPILLGLRYGHCDGSLTIPMGVRARLDTEAKSLVLLEEVTRD